MLRSNKPFGKSKTKTTEITVYYRKAMQRIDAVIY